MDRPQIRALLVDYSAGRLDLDQVAAQLLPVYLDAAAERTERDPGDDDAAWWPDRWTEVTAARQKTIIAPAQHRAIVDAVHRLAGHGPG